MIKSIRKFLLLNLLLAIIITTLITALGNYYLDQKDIQRHLDSLLRQAAFSFEALLGDDLKKRDLSALQQSLNQISDERYAVDQTGFYAPDLAIKYQFQVTDNKGNLLLHSLQAPTKPLSDGKPGFSSTKKADETWRTYTKQNKGLGINVIVAERYYARRSLAHRIAQDDIYIMLLTYPIAGLLIWIIVGRGLRGIDRVAREVSHRMPNSLEPVDAATVPIEIKPLVIELNKLFLRLQQALEREKRFAGDAAHELRTPLAALKTQAQVALKTANDEERYAILSNVIAGVDRCTHVVQQLLTMSRLVPEAGILTDAIPVNLSKLASEIVAQLVPVAIEKQIDIELITNDQDYTVMGNVTALSILIRNLVDNAIRYTPNNSEIKVFVQSDGEQVKLKVIDNGPGIPAELRARVFERFFRVLGNKSPGSGLGLAIVQQIAQLHNAHVKLGPPELGHGLEVEVTFPASLS